ncbi:unnamed protein product [Urochloa humidicola]
MRHSKQPSKLAVLIVLPVLLMCYGVGNVHCLVHENSEDFHSLLKFKEAIDDPKGALRNWNPDTNICRWNGVNCSSTRPYRVTVLNLTSQSLTGPISFSVENLTYLDTLDLSSNNFVGPIPLLDKLQHLRVLDLQSNLLQGVIPDALTNCSNLAFLSLSENMLTGMIPSGIGSLSKLAGLALIQTNLTGTIPLSLGNISTLQVLKLGYNKLSGIIPEEVWHMQNIVQLYLQENNLSGGIPGTLSNLSSLQELSLAVNMLGETLPSNIGYALSNLQVLFLGDNNFGGQIPASIANASKLVKISLASNYFTGQIPSSMGNLWGLYSLDLSGNMLEAGETEGWQFLHALANCSLLNTLLLSNNRLRGAIPNSIANLTNLTYLMMSGNKLSGIVPQSIGKLNSLSGLTLDSNNLTGTVEEWIEKLTNLKHLSLQSNSFIGEILPSISNLTQLVSLSLEENNFSGSIPPSLGNLQHMLKLNLSYNNFKGIIPTEFGSLTQLTSLDLSSNKIIGKIPETLGQCQQLLTIQLDQNLLTGNISTTFRNLNNLKMLNLSHNNLSGPIPSYLNDLKLLTEIDLSYNNFQGQIPTYGIFENVTVVSLDGNPGLCGGVMELRMPPCHVDSKRVGKVNYLVKILIPIFGFMSLALLVYFLLLEKKVSRRGYLAQPSFGEHFEKVTYNDLAQATQDFSESNVIGRGSYGSVYRGKLKENKMEVAVKVFNLEMRGAERSFLSECEALRSIQHRNLLPIITACSTVDNTGNVFKALVYELMPNGNLDSWLHGKGDGEAPKRLGLTQRISIAVNVADALDYLHHDCGRPTVHCDLKPSNILLDDDMSALLGDFGIARFYFDPQAKWAGSISSVGVKGTIGYIPPEYGGGGHASTSGDVYSFGIVLLEILTGKRPTDAMFMDGLDIIRFVENSFPDEIFNAIDVYLLEECNNLTQEKKALENDINHCLVSLLQVALSCTRALPSERSNMKQVASKMHAIKTSHLGWKYK